MHPTSFPGQWGYGDLGETAVEFIDFLAMTKQRLWQVLPLVTPDDTGSPYASVSSFAGNVNLISPDKMVKCGLLHAEEVRDAENVIEDVLERKHALLNLAYDHKTPLMSQRFLDFFNQNHYWLIPNGLYTIFQSEFASGWREWDDAHKTVTAESLEQWYQSNRETVDRLAWQQFILFRQWQDLREYAHNKGIAIVGDIPIFVSYNSVDVWQNQAFFKLESDGSPRVVAGVPPDVFSTTGQLWGNPHYDWEKMAAGGYDWWIKRFRHLLEWVDFIRLDHFRGFDAAWEVRASEKTAENGEWVDGPGEKYFDRLEAEMGRLPIIAEDLGVITERVEALIHRYGFPGMKIFQFAFNSDEHNAFLPHNYPDDRCVVYTGTHDNNTSLGWYRAATDAERENLHHYLNFEGEEDVVWQMIEAAMASKAVWSIFPMQDILSLDEKARMNLPGTSTGNWSWQLESVKVDSQLIEKLTELTQKTGRGE